jgi:anti-sigma regulatory factor (Ser/Thr protein kinase)
MEMIREQILILEIDSDADAGVCRRKSVSLATQLGFDDVKTGEVAILVSELVTNVLKHGGGKGRIMICQLKSDDNRKAIEIWCCDNGNGIPDVEKAMHDGFTGKESLGIGLGTIRRFSDIFEVNPSIVNSVKNTDSNAFSNYKHCLRIVKWVPENRWLGTNRSLTTGAVSRCKPGETLNGDTYLISHLSPVKTIAAIIDGLGHGKEANMASNIIKEQILLKSELPLEELVKYIHQAARGTRGAVIGLVFINTETSKLSFVGIGNIEGFVQSLSGKKSLISYGGILGHSIRTPRVFELPFQNGDSLCLFSDGINTRWNTDEINWKEHPQKNADLLINNYSRPNDDATVLIINYTS